MDVTSLAVGPFGTNCYILTEVGKCLVIDPGDDVQAILGELRHVTQGDGAGQAPGQTPHMPEVQAILITHGHPDHTGAAGALQEATGAPVYVGERDEAMTRDPGWFGQFSASDRRPIQGLRILHEGDEIRLGSTILQVWETPGHSPGSVSFVAEAPGSGPDGGASGGLDGGSTGAPGGGPRNAPATVFAGDVIFLEGVGRTDFPGCDADDLMRSIKRFLALPDDTRIFPGHGDSTTVGHEKALNPFL